MKVFIILVVVLMAISGAATADIFDSLPVDKVAHFGIGLACSHVMQQGWGWKPAQAGAGVVVIASAKEYYDSQTDGYWDNWDLLATLGGWAMYNSISVRFVW